MRLYGLWGPLAVALAISGCSGGNISIATSSTSTPSIAYSSLANGQAIFRTGRDFSGVRIEAQTKPLYGNCAACHRVDGSGGMHLPYGAVSADLRHRALVIEQKRPYDLALLERAISTGIDNQGQRLNPVMPRWRLSARDLHDVALYVLHGLK